MSSPQTQTKSRVRRHNQWTREKMVLFLRELAATQSVSTAAKAVGMSRTAAYALRNRMMNTPFALGWEVALEMGMHQLVHAVMDRALNGVEEQRWYHGELVGTVRRYDNRLAQWILENPWRVGRSQVAREYVASDFEALLERIEAAGLGGGRAAARAGLAARRCGRGRTRRGALYRAKLVRRRCRARGQGPGPALTFSFPLSAVQGEKGPEMAQMRAVAPVGRCGRGVNPVRFSQQRKCYNSRSASAGLARSSGREPASAKDRISTSPPPSTASTRGQSGSQSNSNMWTVTAQATELPSTSATPASMAASRPYSASCRVSNWRRLAPSTRRMTLS